MRPVAIDDLIAAIGGTGFELREDVVLNVGWDSLDSDLVADYGVPGSGAPFAVSVAEELGPAVASRLDVGYYETVS